MQKELQDKFRGELIEFYQKKAFEALGQFDYWGQKYQKIEKNIEEMDTRRQDAQKVIDELTSGAGVTVEVKNRIKALKKDIQDYGTRIASVSEAHKKLFDEATTWREQGVRYLELAESLSTFTMKTPQEIEADKKTSPETSVNGQVAVTV